MGKKTRENEFEVGEYMEEGGVVRLGCVSE